MKIVLGVTGSVACYKSFDLLRALVKSEHEVIVILTKGAENFLRPELFTYLGAKEVYLAKDDFTGNKIKDTDSHVLHVELAKWLDKLVIYPASANTIARLAMGLADDLLSSTFLAKRENTQTIIFPAMNTHMYEHPITKENIDLLERLAKSGKTNIIDPIAGELICKDNGKGKVQSIEVAKELIESINTPSENKKVLITTGATIAPIDPVRYVTNPSSGVTGFSLAKSYLSKGYEVHLIAGKNATSQIESLALHPYFSFERLTTTEDMFKAVKKKINDFDIYISAAAISDLSFEVEDSKLKKSKLNGSLSYHHAPDILKYVLDNKKSSLKVVGFAAETEPTHEALNEKWQRKKVDLLVGTKVHNGLSSNQSRQGFGNSRAEYSFFKNGQICWQKTLSKEELSDSILREIQ